MSKNELDKIANSSKVIGTFGAGAIEEAAELNKKKVKDLENRGKSQGTSGKSSHLIEKTVRFENFEVILELSDDNKFVAIKEITVKQDFRDPKLLPRKKAFQYIDSYQPE